MGPEPIQPSVPAGSNAEGRAAGPLLRLRALGYLSFALIGWSGLLVPVLIRSIEHDFAQTDAGLGVFYFVSAVAWASGGALGGLSTERLGRRVTLPLAAAMLGIGLAGLALAPSWLVFLIAGVPLGLGAGAIDGGVNGLFLDLHPGQGGPLNMLHLFFSIGALVAPLVVGVLVGSGAAWVVIPAGTAVVAVVIAWGFRASAIPSGRRDGGSEHATRLLGPGVSAIPLVLLGVALACYVAAEIGTSSWLVRFLETAPLTVAAASLSLFWAGLAAGRLIASRTADRFDPVIFTIACALVAGVAGIGAVLVPSIPLSIALFALAGLAQGPIYPMIMTLGGLLYPGRSSAVSGLLTAAAVAGSTVYPPVIGFISVTAGIGVGLIGAGALALGSGVAILCVGVLVRGRRPAPSAPEA